MGLDIAVVETVSNTDYLTAAAKPTYPLAVFELEAMVALRSLAQKHLSSLGLTAAIDPTELVTPEMEAEYLALAASLWDRLDDLSDGFGLDILPWGRYAPLVTEAITTSRNTYIDVLRALIGKQAEGTPVYGEFFMVPDYVPGTGLKPPAPYLVQFGDIRSVLGELGGGGSSEVPLATGITGGQVYSDILAENGISTNDKLWLYGETARRTFNGHLQMDGLVFSSWEDDALNIAPQDRWLRTLKYRPGDHWGCACVVVPYVPNFGDPFTMNLQASGGCQDASCAPPPVGTGGSKASGSRRGGTSGDQRLVEPITFNTRFPTGEFNDKDAAVKHYGAKAIVSEMTPRERDAIRAGLDSTFKDTSMTSDEPFASVAYAARANFGASQEGMTAAIAFQLAGIRTRYLSGSDRLGDNYEIMDAVQAELSRYADGIPKNKRAELIERLSDISGITPEYGLVSYVNQQWVQGPDSEVSTAMHMTVTRKFNLVEAEASLRKYNKGSTGFVSGVKLAKQKGDVLMAVADATYRTTQKFLRNEGYDEVTLVRGVSGVDPSTAGQYIAQGSPLSSWTTNTNVALDFGPNVFRSTFDADRIYSIAAATGNGSFDEREMVVLGRPTEADLLAPAEFSVSDPIVVYVDKDDADWIRVAAGRGILASGTDVALDSDEEAATGGPDVKKTGEYADDPGPSSEAELEEFEAKMAQWREKYG